MFFVCCYWDIVETFSKVIDVQEIGYETNRGPGYARQYGIDHTEEDFINIEDIRANASSIIKDIQVFKRKKDK